MAHAETHGHAAPHQGAHHPPSHYVKIWVVLCALLAISIVGPMLGHKLVTLIAAFGIAIVKAWMVASYFMHLNIEKKFATLLLLTMMAALVVFWYGIAPDVQKHEGVNWDNRASQEFIERRMKEEEAAGAAHGDHAAPADHGGGGH